jgi:glutamate carboxypeptidase
VNPKHLPFDAEPMLAGLKPWIECESPTFDAGAVNRMMALAARDLAALGAEVEPISGRMSLGDCLRASFPHADDGSPGVLILGHFDTVHPVGTLEMLPWRREGSRCYGPGILDMKGGNFLALEAVRQLIRAGIETPLPVTILFTSDEEIGSPSTRDLIQGEAGRHRYILVPEPGRNDGGVVTGRYAIARYNMEATGRPSHAGARLAEGRFGRAHDGAQDSRDRGYDERELHVQRRRGSWRHVGELRADDLPCRGAEHGQASVRSRSWGRADAGAHRHL